MVSCFLYLLLQNRVWTSTEGLRDSKASDFSYSYEALVQKEALIDHICQDRLVASFVIFMCSISISFKKWVFAEESLYLSIVISVY